MPPNPQRRTLILDAAIDILNDVGVGGVTHRQVDERAGLPPGTTSNYFRTRLALLEATAGRVVELHWRNVAALQRLGGSTGDRRALVTLMGALISSPDPAVRRLLIARYELSLEATRRPELRPLMDEMAAAAMTSARSVLRWGGIDASDEQLARVSRMLNGLAFSQLTVSQSAQPAGDIGELADALLRAVFG
jgi:DNA-binding transcriptional regulator YbjK